MIKIFIVFFGFIICVPAFSQKYFEGTVEYDITFQVSSPDLTEQAMKIIFGTRLKFYHKDGTYMREYLDENGNTLRKMIYLAAANKLYLIETSAPDTIYTFNAEEKLFDDYKIVKGPKETILGCECPSRIITYKNFEKIIRDTIHVRLEYFFCHDFPVNTDYYKNYYIWYDVVKEEKSIGIKFTEEWEGYFKISYTAKKIDKVKIEDKIFEFDKNAVQLDHKFKDQ